MPMTHLTEILALVTVLGLTAQWLAWRLHLPAIVLLTLFGLLAGPVFGIIRPHEALGDVFHPLIKLGVAAILFEGGLNLHWHELAHAARGVWRLVTVAVILSLGLGAAAAHLIGGLSWPVATLFGAITVVTGPTVIMPLLRQARLRRRPASFLKWEGIVNDPTGALLTVVAFQYFVGAEQTTVMGSIGKLGLGLFVATGLGVGTALLLGVAFRRGWVPEYLKGPGALALALGIYALSNLVLDEAGLVAATVMGVTLGNLHLPSIDELRRFKEYVAVLLVSVVFLLLTADLDPTIMFRLDWRAFALLAAVMVLVRPLTIGLATIGSGMSWQERTLVGWIAPRGVVAAAVAGVFGPALAAQGFVGAELLLPLIFGLILATVVIHGFSLSWLARRLELSAAPHGGLLIVGSNAWSRGLAKALKEQKLPVLLADNSWHRLRPARLDGVPVYYGELLSEHAEASIELNEMGSLFATTDNDAYNALVCAHFAPDLGRTQVSQLPEPEGEEPESRRLTRALRGLQAPADNLHYEDLARRWGEGWTFQSTGLTETFDYEAFLDALPEGAMPMVVVKPNGRLTLNSVERPIKGEPGDTLIWFGARRARDGKSAGNGVKAPGNAE